MSKQNQKIIISLASLLCHTTGTTKTNKASLNLCSQSTALQGPLCCLFRLVDLGQTIIPFSLVDLGQVIISFSLIVFSEATCRFQKI
jgi:hypothetical protein